MNYEMRKDEQLYVPPVRLLDNHSLYADFFYNHPPGSAWLFHWIGTITGSDHLLLSGRLGVLLGWILLIAGIGAISYILTRSALVSWCIVVLSTANQLFLMQTGMSATNNLLPLPLSFLGLGVFVLAVKDDRARPLLAFLAGCLLSFAAGFKVSAVAFIPPVALAAFFLPRAYGLGQRLTHVVLPLAIGGVIGGLVLVVPLVTDPARFLAHVVRYHTGPHLAYWSSGGDAGEDAVMSLGAKLLLAQEIWFGATVAVALSVLLAFLLTTVWKSPEGRAARPHLPVSALLVVLGALVFSAGLSLLPTPSFPQYFAPPLICLPLGLALLYGSLESEAGQRLKPVIVAATAVVLLIAAPRLVQYLPTILDPQKWTVMRVHDAGVSLAQRMSQEGASGKVATLWPVYPLEGNLEVYPELATGPFAYRTGDITDPDLAAQYRMTSPTTVGALLDSDPPAALLLGFDEALERPLLDYAERNRYVKIEDLGIKDRYGVPVLYLRPSAPVQTTPVQTTTP
ncbi:hypothetical protein [Sinorhizobium sp. BG8]|uniref:hypothetical protein n=1 Tax=Sinorhizobium sp. BG8 TaxID=2613773 RepID=UPI00193E5AB5|nr:hypothetical protein [Sinorhizobium sp. BG8]QRM56092.1 hypothetical protein F3Y30_17290 [Sinorhizobium sp. BG8]